MPNQRLMLNVLKILKHRINLARTAQYKSAYIFAYNLIVYAMQGNAAKLNEIMENEGINNE